jgi:hypothetical protein
MRRTTTILAATALCLGTLTACNGTDEVTTKPKASKTTAPPAADKPAPAPKPSVAKAGDTITVKGIEAGEQVDVTLKQIADPAKPADEFFKPDDGNRWIGAQFEIVNTGTKVYADSPGNGAQLADSKGQRFTTTFAEISAGPAMTSDANVPPGEKVLGWLVFEVPKTSTPATIQFTMNSGFSDQTGQWKLN